MEKKTAHKSSGSSSSTQYVGPYRIQKTLGKGQTGLVKLGVHCVTDKKVAIKIVNREKLTESVLMKVEREITIMKLIDHPHVLKLYDVYESKKYLYLILEHVSGGELFDYLVRKGRLSSKEARKFFRQIISALDFCHAHYICHRDLKPENLLLDESLNIKVADFGMASLQVNGNLLETSCGSPHYACPEVIKGDKYDGKKADVWSCGVILYALLVGALPFDDDNLRHLLEKVKRGTFHIPHFVSPDCQNLLKGMIEVDPDKRLQLYQIFRHPWVATDSKFEYIPEIPVVEAVQTAVINSESEMDIDVLTSMTSLGCFKEREKLIKALLSNKHNTEKVIYFLLLDRKIRNTADTAHTDPTQIPSSLAVDVPIKRLETYQYNEELNISRSLNFGPLTEGSPLIPRRPLISLCTPRYKSANTTPANSPCNTPRVSKKDYSIFILGKGASREKLSDEFDPVSLHSSNSSVHWKSKLSSLKQNLYAVGTPRFHRKKCTSASSDSDYSSSGGNISTESSTANAKKSWFQQLTSYLHEESHIILFKRCSLAKLKADLIYAFLSIPDLIHSIISDSQFTCEYRRHEISTILNRNVRFIVEIHAFKGDEVNTDTFYVIFNLTSGSYRIFKRICSQIQAHLEKHSLRKSVPYIEENDKDLEIIRRVQ